LKKQYEIEQQRAVQQFRRIATEQNPSIQMILPPPETVGLLQQGVGNLLRETGLALMQLVMEEEVKRLAGERHQQHEGRSTKVLVRDLGIPALIAFLPRELAASGLGGTLSIRLLAFAFCVTLAAGLRSGLAPALHAGGDRLVNSLRERAGTGFGGVRPRKCIVTLQLTLSLILVIGAELFLRTLTALLTKGPGFETTGILSFAIAPVQSGYSLADASRLVRRLLEEVRALPATRDSAATRNAFLTGGSWNGRITIQTDRHIITDIVNLNGVIPGFFSTLGIRILAGRNFDTHDSHPPDETAHRSVIVNEAFVKRYLAGRNPLGIRIGEGAPDVKTDIVIAGVCGNFNYRDLRDGFEQAFVPMFEGDDAGATSYVKVRGAPEQAIPSIRRIVRQDAPGCRAFGSALLTIRSTARYPPSASWPLSPAASGRWRCCSRLSVSMA